MSACRVVDDVVIRTEQLTKVYPGGLKAVDELDLAVHQGEIFGLLGPNGAGKTTTAGMLTTRVIPTSGRAFVGGIDVVAHPTAAKQVIGVVPQTQHARPLAHRVGEPLLPRPLLRDVGRRRRRPRPTACSSSSGSPSGPTEPVAALSGGMAQRLMVARAIMHRPAILFLDEPTAGLDPQSRIALWEILGELHGDGQTILLTTHYMEEADELCDRLAIIDHGRLLALGTPGGAQALDRRRHRGDRHRRRRPRRAGQGARGRASPGATQADARRRHGRASRCRRTARRAARSCSAPPNVTASTVSDLSVTEPTLETVFINLTGKDLRE